MFYDPYQTTLVKNYKTDGLRRELTRGLLGDQLGTVLQKAPYQNRICKSVYCVTFADGHQEIDNFTQPIVLAEDAVVVDARPFIATERDGKIIVRSQMEYDLLVLRALLTVQYINGQGAGVINNLMAPSWRLFDRIVTSTIVNATQLRNDYQTQSRISILTAIYWLSMYQRDIDEMADHPDAVILQLSRITPYPINEIESVYNKVGPIKDLDAFCSALYPATENPRLERMRLMTFTSMISTVWWGVNATETVLVSMEHIPTFLALLYTCLTTRNFKRTTLYQRVTDFKDRRIKQTIEESIHRVAMGGCE